MPVTAEHTSRALRRFGRPKQADLLSNLPSIAGPALGAYLGKRFHGDVGQLVGGIGGSIAGLAAREALQPASNVPPGAPYAIDSTAEDIPPWALSGAQLLQPAVKFGASEHEGFRDSVLGDLMGPAYPVTEALRSGGGVPAVLKHLLASSGGIAAGGALGYGLGQLLPKKTVWGIPLSTITSGLGATIGGVKGLDVARRGLGALRGR